MEIPLVIFISVMIGSLARAIWGWMDSGELFIARKFMSTMIFTVFAVAIPIASAMMAANLIVIGPYGMFGICLSALIAGWGSDSALKELSKSKNSSK